MNKNDKSSSQYETKNTPDYDIYDEQNGFKISPWTIFSKRRWLPNRLFFGNDVLNLCCVLSYSKRPRKSKQAT